MVRVLNTKAKTSSSAFPPSLEEPDSNYRPLSEMERRILVENRNVCDNWDALVVSEPFDPHLVQNCRFSGTVKIGSLTPTTLEAEGIELPAGLYNSHLGQCELGDRVALHNVNYLSRYTIGDECLMLNVGTLYCTVNPSFGRGESSLEVANEKGTRAIGAFESMLPGDAWLWSKFRHREVLQESFCRWTAESNITTEPGFGHIAARSSLINCSKICNGKVGQGASLSGVLSLNQVTLSSTFEQPVFVGAGVELQRGIMARGAKALSGAKAFDFYLDEESCLEKGARLAHTYLGANSTIACCEVLNALIFPFHEQHHNNSFLIATTLKGQSNLAAAATVGSNHNSRGADGEIVAERGFWPGLAVSLKHNSRFAPFTLIAKGSYPAELTIELPFTLVSNSPSDNGLTLFPAYWFQHNMYALARNGTKFSSRDKRVAPLQKIECHYLAPDSVEAVMSGLSQLEQWCGLSHLNNQSYNPGQILVEDHTVERGRRPLKVIKPARAWRLYRELVNLYLALNIIEWRSPFSSFEGLKNLIVGQQREQWYNMGGQLVPQSRIDQIEQKIIQGNLTSWDDLHHLYTQWGEEYSMDKLKHSAACYFELHPETEATPKWLEAVLNRALRFEEELLECTKSSRKKDFTDPFRKLPYSTDAEMTAVLGEFTEDAFIKTSEKRFSVLTVRVKELLHAICG